MNHTLSTLHDPYNTAHLAFGKKDPIVVNDSFHTAEDLLSFYFESPTSTHKTNHFEPPKSKW